MYRTIHMAAEAEFVEKRSRFIGYIRPICAPEEAQELLAALRKQHWDARHHVSAFICREGDIRRCSDDGEPQGTAGMPTLDVLQKAGVCDVAVVVVRYFGGILLGGGGLVRAYGHTASLALAAAGITEMHEGVFAAIECSYAQYGWLQPSIAAAGGQITATDFTDSVTIRFSLPRAAWGALTADITERSAGSLAPVIESEGFLPVLAVPPVKN